MNITLRNVSERVYRVINREAKKHGRSLSAEIIRILESAATESERRRCLSVARKDLDRFVATLQPFDSSAPLIRRDRER